MVKNFLLVLVSLVVGLALVEGALRAFVPLRDVGPPLSVYDETYGARLRPSFSAIRETPEYTMKITTNSSGFRGPEPAIFPARSVLFLGDSFTMGFGVSDGAEFPALARKALTEHYEGIDIPAVNAGLGHSGHGYWLKFLRSEGDKYNPRLIIMQFFENDFSDNIQDHLFELTPDNTLRELPVAPRSLSRRLQDIIESVPGLTNLYLVGLARQVFWWLIVYGPVSEDQLKVRVDEREEQLTYRIVEETLALTQDKGWPVLAITIQIEGQRLANLREIFERNDVDSITMPGKQSRPEFYFSIDDHWNAAGHVHASNVIFDWLIANEQDWLRER